MVGELWRRIDKATFIIIIAIVVLATALMVALNASKDECAAKGGQLTTSNGTVIVNGKVGVGTTTFCVSKDGHTIL